MIVLSFCIVGCSTGVTPKSNNNENFMQGNQNSLQDNESSRQIQSQIDSIYVGDEYVFGKYEQDNNLSNGKEDIKWIILEKNNDKILLISKYALEPKYYNDTKAAVTWENCTLRAWLNNDFYNEAFNSEEQNIIEITTVVADSNSDFSQNPGKNTQDKVFLLSKKECLHYFNGSEKICQMTPYGLVKKKDLSGGTYNGTENCWWWLRVSGEAEQKPSHVDTSGDITRGSDVDSTYMGVRPAIWITVR